MKAKDHPYEHNSWRAMKERCYRLESKSYKNYGGRGITVHDPWRKSFTEFYHYMGPKPSKDYTIERIDNSKGYYPGNVRWALKSEQPANRRYCHKIEYMGHIVNLATFCKVTGAKRGTIDGRRKRGWTLSEAINTPATAIVVVDRYSGWDTSLNGKASMTRFVVKDDDGATLPLREFCHKYGYKYASIHYRLKRYGMTVQGAINSLGHRQREKIRIGRER
jgi:hypothetical protein